MIHILHRIARRSLFFLGLFLAVASLRAQDRSASSGIPVEAQYEAEIRTLAAQPDVQAGFEAIEALEPQTREDHIRLTEIAAPPFKEERRAQAFAEMLSQAGADSVWIDAEGNVLALRRGRTRNRTIVLDAHLDTVFPEETDVRVRMRGDTLAAPGVSDDTRGLVLVLTVLRAMERAGIETDADLLFVGTVGEEGLGDLRGMKYIFREGGPRIDAWIAIDGTNPQRIVHRGLGSHRYRVTFGGPGGHSWGAFGLASPHHALADAITRFVNLADAYTRVGPRTSYNVGRIGGGTSVNSIAFESWMEVDMRSVSAERLIGIDSLFHLAIRGALLDHNNRRRGGEALTVEIKSIGDRPSGEIPVDTPLIQRILAVTQYFGVEPRLAVSSTNANIPISKGVPSFTIGAGGVSHGAHSLDEWWVNTGGALAIQRALLMLVAEAGHATP